MSRQPRSSPATTLVLSSTALPAAPRLAEAARRRGWAVVSLEESGPDSRPLGEVVFYGSTLEAEAAARRFGLALLEPPLDLLARLPPELLLRRVSFCQWSEVGEWSVPSFLKPADPLHKVFDAGVYRGRGQIRTARPPPPQTPVLVAEPVEWLAEYRCFVLEGEVVAASPYLSFGRPLRHAGTARHEVPPAIFETCRRLLALRSPPLPPGLVVDVGLIEDRGWAVVEFNPVWCSGLLSADPDPVLDVLRRCSRAFQWLNESDDQWVLRR